MPPPVAALLTVGFVFWLFRRYSKEAGPMPIGLWIPFIWVGINASRPVGFWLSSGTAAAASGDISDGSFIDRNTYLVLLVIGICILARRRIDWPNINRNLRWLYILYGYYLISTLWSDYTYVAFKRWVKDAGDIVMILILLTEKDPAEAIRAVFVRCAYVLVPVSVLFIKWYPELGRYTHRWSYQTMYNGVSTNKNGLGLLAMMSGLFLLWQIVDVYRQRGRRFTLLNRWPDLVTLLMSAWILTIANSSTALACFILGTTIFFAARLAWVKANLRRLNWCLLGLAILMLAFTVSTEFRGVIAGALGRDVTLTERTVIWEKSLELNTNPILGSGFFSTWLTKDAAEFVEEFHLSHAHNGYLETYLHTGFIGVFLLLGVLVSAGRNATSHFSHGSSVGYLFITAFLTGLIYNYAEVSFSRSNALGLFLWLMAAYGAVYKKKLMTDETNKPILTSAGPVTIGQ
jgi:exopolysaccharide production protein ExoQ